MSSTSAKRVLLIGWDAADWSFLTPLLDSGKMPSLQKLIERGTSGRIATLQPILSPILWTSIATGKRGDKHGILSFVEPMPNGEGIRPVSSYSRRAKALWNILSQLGRRSVIVNWFASHPAEPINGAIVSNRYSQSVLGSPTIDETSFHPRDLAEVMAKLRVTASDLTPEQMTPFFPEKLPQNEDNRLHKLAYQVAQTASVHNAATYLAEAEDWDFLAVYYDMIDHVGHDFAEYGPPRMEHVSEDDFKIYSNVMESTYRYHDLMLGRWLELIDDQTAVILLSDHGFYHGAGRPLAERARLSGERPQGVHSNPLIWHRLHGVFVAQGPGIKADSLVHSASLLDVAPTILSLLDLPVPNDFEGKVLTAIFENEVDLKITPSLEEPHPDDGVHRSAPVEEKDPWAAQQAVAQLVELGYVDSPAGDIAQGVAAAVESHDSHLAQIYFSTGRFAEALELLDRLTSQSADPSFPARQAMCLVGLRRFEEAEVIVQKVLASNPYYGLAKMLSGQIAAMRGKTAEAETIFKELHRAEADMPALHAQLGSICLQQRRWQEAAEFFRRALEADPDLPEAHDGLGVALRHLGEVEEAINEHMLAVSLLHDRPQSHINLGLSLVRGRQIDWAIRAFTVATELAPSQPYPHRCLARIYRKIRPDYEKARHHLLRARQLRRELDGRTPLFRQGV